MSIQRKLTRFLVAGAVLLVVGVSVVGASGPVGSEFLINAEPHKQVFPAIAYNPERQEYLVVWYNDRPEYNDIYAQRVAWNGRLVGPWFAVAWGGSLERYCPDVVYNPTQKQYLVVWEEYDGTCWRIRGQRLTDVGQRVGSVIPISDPVSKDCDWGAVAYALAADRYLVVWNSSSSGGWNIEGQALSTTGALLGSDVVIATGTAKFSHFDPDVAYNRSRNEYLVVWQRWDSDTQEGDIYGRRVQGSGTPMGAGGFPIQAMSAREGLPRVAAIPTEPNQGRYLVVWKQHDRDLHAQRLKGDGNPDSIPFWLGLTSNSCPVPAVAGSEGGREFLVAWTGYEAGSYRVQARTVPLEGEALGPETGLAGGAGAAVTAGRLGEFLVAYQDGEPSSVDTDVYGRLWGTWVHMPLVIRRR